MPKGDWGHGSRPWHPQSARLFPRLEQTPDISRGEQRLVAEVMIERFEGKLVPPDAIRKALIIAEVMARG